MILFDREGWLLIQCSFDKESKLHCVNSHPSLSNNIIIRLHNATWRYNLGRYMEVRLALFCSRIERNKLRISSCSGSNTGKEGAENTPYLDTVYAMYTWQPRIQKFQRLN